MLQPIGLAFQTLAPGLVHRVQHLAVHVELELLRRRVADAHRLGPLVAGQPVQLHLRQPPLAGQAVHDVRRGGVAGHRPMQPRPPGVRLLEVAAAHQGHEREGGVAQPAVAVVPVAHAADLLRQRSRRRRHDAAGRGVGQGFQRYQGAQNGVTPRPLVGAAAGPFAPPPFRLLDAALAIDRLRRRPVRRVPAQREGHALALGHGEVGRGFEVLVDEGDRRCGTPAGRGRRWPRGRAWSSRCTHGTTEP